MKHERFVELAKEKAYNRRGGLLSLAAHVRQLYRAIREMQEDDNAFAYIAEVIQEARKDKIDAEAFMHRVKTYYHRDRKALGDRLVVRGSKRMLALARTHNVAADSADRPAARISPVEAKEEAVPDPGHRPVGSESSAVPAKPHQATAKRASPEGQASSLDDRRHLTAALRRRGHRRIAPGG